MTKMNRWLRAAAGVLLMLFLGAIYAWSYFKAGARPLNFTILMSRFCLGGLLAGMVLRAPFWAWRRWESIC